MVINNLSAQANTECGLLQQELLKSFVEQRKQRGITESLMQRLAAKKLDAINDMYGNVRVTHKEFGECGSDFSIDVLSNRIELTLNYYVKKIPLDGLSKHDKSIARRYNESVYSYSTANDVSADFKTFHPSYGLADVCYWEFSIDDILKSNFLTEGIRIDNEADSPFDIFLK